MNELDLERIRKRHEGRNNTAEAVHDLAALIAEVERLREVEELYKLLNEEALKLVAEVERLESKVDQNFASYEYWKQRAEQDEQSAAVLKDELLDAQDTITQREEACKIAVQQTKQAEQRVRTLREALMEAKELNNAVWREPEVLALVEKALADTADASPAEGEG